MPKTVEDAIIFATNAHAGQKDKNGQPYIYHPIRVMLAVNTDYEKQVAVMHDVVEDTDITLEDISNAGFSNEVVKAIGAITKKPNQNYDDYLVIVKGNPISRTTKIADVGDNSSPMRLYKLAPCTMTRLVHKYAKAVNFLTEE